MNVQIVVGCGETGGPLADLLEHSGRTVKRLDPIKGLDVTGLQASDEVDAMHVCIPWSGRFKETVAQYAHRFKPSIVIIHSTVPVGTTKELKYVFGISIVHSPVRGMHATMERDMKLYIKMIGYDDESDAGRAIAAMDGVFQLMKLKDSRTTELGKLLEQGRYGLNIAFAREQNLICKELGLSYQSVVDEFIRTHNLGMEARQSPDLRQQKVYPPEGPIGGHCVLPAMKTISEQFQPFLLTLAYSQEAMISKKNSDPMPLCAEQSFYTHPTAVVHPAD